MKPVKRVALGLKDIKPLNLVAFGNQVVAQMRAHQDIFLSPPVDLDTLEADLQALQEHEQLLRNRAGGHSIRVKRDDMVIKVKASLEYLSYYVMIVAQGEESVISMAGMSVRGKGPLKYETILAPVNLRVTHTGNSGAVSLRWEPVFNARQYAIEYCLGEPEAGNWVSGDYSGGCFFLKKNLPVRRQANFRVMSLGAAGKSGWSQVVSINVS
ncbi:MAG: fibronectin type III domain-containing protein [Sphingobacteriales bacterium]|nr:MAG: fibronectin type III domain-containing protein [Sphingobacteriales bacterium]